MNDTPDLIQPLRILCIADDTTGQGPFASALNETGLALEYTSTSHGQQALTLCNQHLYDLVIADHRPPQFDALRMGAEMRKLPGYQFTPLLFLFEGGDESLVAEAFKAGFQDYLSKRSLEASQLRQCLLSAIEATRLQEEHEANRYVMMQHNHELERRHHLFSEYWNDVSHALLTPLASVQEFISLVLDQIPGEINPEQGKYLALARGGCQKIELEIAQLRQISAIENVVDISASCSHSLLDIMEAVTADVSVEAQLHHVSIGLHYPDDLPHVRIDKYRIAQVFYTLLLRSITVAGQQGRVIISATRQSHQSNAVNVSIQAHDNGPRNSNLHPDAFSEWTGCSAIIAMHGGDLLVEHRTDGSSEFQFQLPIAATASPINLQGAA